MAVTIPSFSDSRDRMIAMQSPSRLIGPGIAVNALAPGCTRAVVAAALRRPSAVLERETGTTIDVSPTAFFPERRDSRGGRLQQLKNKSIRRVRNVKKVHGGMKIGTRMLRIGGESAPISRVMFSRYRLWLRRGGMEIWS